MWKTQSEYNRLSTVFLVKEYKLAKRMLGLANTSAGYSDDFKAMYTISEILAVRNVDLTSL